jgi:hypothetical protein
VRLLVKNLDKTMPERVVQELAALRISVQGVMQLRSGRHSQDGAQDCPSLSRCPEVTKLRSLTCGLRISVETYAAPKGPVKCKRCEGLGHTQRNYGYTTGCVACGEAHQSGGCSTPRSSLNAASAGGTTLPTTGDVQNGKRRRRPLQGGHRPKPPTQEPQPALLPWQRRPVPSAEQQSLGGGWNHDVRGTFC